MKTLLLRAALAVIVLSAALTVVFLVRTATLETVPRPQGEAQSFSFDERGAVERLSAAIGFETISPERAEDRDPAAWREFHEFLETSFPRVHQVLELETVSDLTLLYTWQGTDRELAPILLAAHSDVVPAAEDALNRWSHPPFSGEVAGGFVWGRGALDHKGPLMAILEAVEGLLEDGFSPNRTVLLAFGHDEERGGGEGAREVARLLEERGVRPSWVLDEGFAVVSGVVPGLWDPIGVVGTTEKGVMSLVIRARTEGGHSAFPPAETAIGIVSRAVARLEENPFPARIRGPTREAFARLGPHLDPGTRMLVANLWLLERPVARALTERPEMASMLRSTMAPTIVEGGDVHNVLPTEARALVNVRIAPWDTPDAVLERIRELLADLPVEIDPRGGGVEPTAPSPVSSTDSDGFAVVRGSIHRIFRDVIAVVPAVAPAATDGRHYAGVAENVYRFAPFRADEETMARIHGVDERIRVTGYYDMIRFYAELLRAGAG